MKTIFHAYRFDTQNPEQSAAYEKLREQMKSKGIKQFHAFGNYYLPELDGKELTLDTAFLFANQWNAEVLTNGLRVFDWAEEHQQYQPNIKRGHWLEITDEMQAIRRETKKCGYCGKNYAPGTAKDLVFCSACLDSPFLKENDLYLLRLLPVADEDNKRMPLTDTERAALLPVYIEHQTTGANSRAVEATKKLRAEIENKFTSAIRNATDEHDGMLWLLDHGVNIENVIYYSHTSMFSFGWRSPVSASVKSHLLDVLCEFPYAYEIKAENETVKTR
jgi:hypothetical protein